MLYLMPAAKINFASSLRRSLFCEKYCDMLGFSCAFRTLAEWVVNDTGCAEHISDVVVTYHNRWLHEDLAE